MLRFLVPLAPRGTAQPPAPIVPLPLPTQEDARPAKATTTPAPPPKKQKRTDSIQEVPSAQEHELTTRGERKRKCARIALKAVRSEEYDAFLESDSDDESDDSYEESGSSEEEEVSSSESDEEPRKKGKAPRARGKGARVDATDESSVSDDEASDEYVIERILKERTRYDERRDDFVTQFKVKWAGHEELTWEPEVNLEQTAALEEWRELAAARLRAKRAARKAEAAAKVAEMEAQDAAQAEEAAALDDEPKASCDDEASHVQAPEELDSQADADSQEESDDGDEYEVESIRTRRVRYNEEGQAVEEFLVRWVGYSCDDDTWQPREHLLECKVFHEWEAAQAKTAQVSAGSHAHGTKKPSARGKHFVM